MFHVRSPTLQPLPLVIGLSISQGYFIAQGNEQWRGANPGTLDSKQAPYHWTTVSYINIVIHVSETETSSLESQSDENEYCDRFNAQVCYHFI